MSPKRRKSDLLDLLLIGLLFLSQGTKDKHTFGQPIRGSNYEQLEQKW